MHTPNPSSSLSTVKQIQLSEESCFSRPTSMVCVRLEPKIQEPQEWLTSCHTVLAMARCPTTTTPRNYFLPIVYHNVLMLTHLLFPPAGSAFIQGATTLYDEARNVNYPMIRSLFASDMLSRRHSAHTIGPLSKHTVLRVVLHRHLRHSCRTAPPLEWKPLHGGRPIICVGKK